MTKYSIQFKVKVVQEYLNGGISCRNVCKKYGIPSKSTLVRWVDLARIQGLEALKIRHNYTKYSTEFKLAVVTCYRSHEWGANKVAASFNLTPSLVYSWYRRYQKEGIVGLRPKVKGQSSKNMNKKKTKPIKTNLTATKEEKYQQEIAELKAKLAYAKMENDILKKLRALRQQEEKNKH